MKFFARTEFDNRGSYTSSLHYVLLRGETLGPYRTDELRRLPGFTLQTPIRSSPNQDWTPAFSALDLGTYFGNSQRRDTGQTVKEILAEKRKQIRREKWGGMQRNAGKFFSRLIFWSSFLLFLAVSLYAFRYTHFQIQQWQEKLEKKGHVVLQQMIVVLQTFDARYLAAPIPEPTQTFAAETPPPATTVETPTPKIEPVKAVHSTRRLIHKKHAHRTKKHPH